MSDINLSQASPSSILDISNLSRQKKDQFPINNFIPLIFDNKKIIPIKKKLFTLNNIL